MNKHDDMNSALMHVLMSDEEGADALNREFASMFGERNIAPGARKILTAKWVTTPLGAMLAITDERALFLLEFFDRRALVGEVKRLIKRTQALIVPGITDAQIMLEGELGLYFSGRLKNFETPVDVHGTPFQLAAWQALREIPYGETRSYQEQAAVVGKPLAHRAVANANGCNQIAVVFPCHRIIKSDNSLGGYGGKIYRKQWLLDLEKRFA